MLNERNEITAILEGKRVDKKHTYRSCYLLAKHFKKELETTDILTIREAIFNWANKYGITVTDNLNYIIKKSLEDKHEIIEDIQVRLNENDIYEITRRFDKYSIRITAFATLCFAKVHADKNHQFYMSLVGLENWIGVGVGNVNKYIQELVDLRYISCVEDSKTVFIKSKRKPISKTKLFKLLPPYNNEGEIIFTDTNIRSEFEKIFGYK